MSLTINTNIDAIVANNDLVNTQNSLSTAIQDLSWACGSTPRPTTRPGMRSSRT